MYRHIIITNHNTEQMCGLYFFSQIKCPVKVILLENVWAGVYFTYIYNLVVVIIINIVISTNSMFLINKLIIYTHNI